MFAQQPVQRLSFIDALRGIASLGVVIFHAAEGNHINNLPDTVRGIATYGALGVPIFFVISGFVIAHSLRDQQMTLTNFCSFVARRSIRLDPPYWVAIAITIGFSMLAAKIVPGRHAETYSTVQVVAHLTYTQNIIGLANINPVFWTLCYEVQFYLVFATLLFFRSKLAIVGALLVSLLWCFRIAPDVPGWFPNLWFAFLLGVSAWYSWTYRVMIPIYFAYLAAVAASALWFGDSFAGTCSATSALIFMVAAGNLLSKALNWRWLQFLGMISYSLYLIHNPVTGAVFRLGKIITGNSAISEWFWWTTSLMLCMIAASCMWFFVERPCMYLSKQLSRGLLGVRTSPGSANSNINSQQHLG